MSTSTEPTAFGDYHIIPPSTAHTHTIVLLHGRGSTGAQFADELFDTIANDDDQVSATTANDLFPSVRWVFPSSRSQWDRIFEEYMPAWFEAPSLADPSDGRDVQVPGICDAVVHIDRLLEDEVVELGGRSDKMFLGGISQGSAIAMLALLSRGCGGKPGAGDRVNRFAGFLAASTWLPFVSDIDQGSAVDIAGDAIVDLITIHNNPDLLETPLLFGHGVDDAYVDADLGREAFRVLTKIGFRVEWKEYSGAEQEGHWLQMPDQVNDIIQFLRQNM